MLRKKIVGVTAVIVIVAAAFIMFYLWLNATCCDAPLSEANPKVVELMGQLPEPEPYCGDAVCSSFEDCSTCPEDCGECEEASTIMLNTEEDVQKYLDQLGGIWPLDECTEEPTIGLSPGGKWEVSCVVNRGRLNPNGTMEPWMGARVFIYKNGTIGQSMLEGPANS
ncbi:MAG: hypothetical protein JXB14_05360 [Candidatus Altiarchaeota archaeon]|nr:hypothetical protein [Candidatus Altiarchaeota archaeon]